MSSTKLSLLVVVVVIWFVLSKTFIQRLNGAIQLITIISFVLLLSNPIRTNPAAESSSSSGSVGVSLPAGEADNIMHMTLSSRERAFGSKFHLYFFCQLLIGNRMISDAFVGYVLAKQHLLHGPTITQSIALPPTRQLTALPLSPVLCCVMQRTGHTHSWRDLV